MLNEIQIYGMSAKMAVAFANVFMARIENPILRQS